MSAPSQHRLRSLFPIVLPSVPMEAMVERARVMVAARKRRYRALTRLAGASAASLFLVLALPGVEGEAELRGQRSLPSGCGRQTVLAVAQAAPGPSCSVRDVACLFEGCRRSD